MSLVTFPSTLRGTHSGAQIAALSTANIPALTTSQISALPESFDLENDFKKVFLIKQVA